MCRICVEYQKGLLTANEARRNAAEIVVTADPDSPDWEHASDIFENLLQEPEPDEQAVTRMVSEGGKDK